MPRRTSKTTRTVRNVTSRRQAPQVRNVTTVVSRSTARRNRRSRRRNTNPSQVISTVNIPVEIQCYADTLNNPFEHPACKLGFGVFVESDVISAFARFAATAGSDGSYGVSLWPAADGTTNCIYVTNQVVSGTSAWAALGPDNMFNGNMIDDAFIGARVVSGGLRIRPAIPRTSAPATFYAGSLPNFSQNSVSTSGATAKYSYWTTNPLLRMGTGYEGAAATIRPTDADSFTFQYQVTSGPTSVGNQSYSSSPMIIMTGAPANCPLTVEIVLNLEGIAGQTAGSSSLGISSAMQYTSGRSTGMLSQIYPSIEQMWNVVKTLLIPDGLVANEVNILSSFGSHVSNALARSGRSAFQNVTNTASQVRF